MLGLGFAKLIVLVLAAVGGWYLFRMLGGPSVPRRGAPSGPAPQARERDAGARSGRAIEAQDMVRCTLCGTYVAAEGAKPCDNAACPWRR